MQRRALLTTLAAGVASIAGCSGNPNDSTGPTDDTTTSTTPPGDPGHQQTTENAPKPPETGLGGATTAVLETGDRTLSLLGSRFRLPSGLKVRSWLSNTATPEHPARITTTVANPTSNHAALQLRGIGPLSDTPFARAHDPDTRETPDGGLYLVPMEGHEFATHTPSIARDDGFWYLDESPDDWHPRSIQLDPGEVAVAEQAVVTHVDYPGRLHTGRYRFGHGDERISIVVWETSQPGPVEQSRFEAESPPAFENMRPEWYHEANRKTPVYLEPSAERIAAPGQVEFELHNYRTESLTGNRHDWELYKAVDGEWFKIAPWMVVVPLTPLPPGETFTWTLRAFNDAAVSGDGSIDIGHLGGGRYAFHVNLHPEKRPTRAALFDLEAPAVSVSPTDDSASSRSGGIVTVDGPGYRKDDPEEATLVVERTGTAFERIIPEQVMRRRNQGLRNTLSFFQSDVERVELNTDDQTVYEAVGHDDEPRKFRFDEQAYVARRGES